MANDRWEQLKQLFEAALARDPSERRAFLQGAFALDPSLRKEVESLIASHEDSDSFLEVVPMEELKALSLDTTAVTRQRGAETESENRQQIGPYRILSEIGHGGMGVVYEAEQEKPVHRRVALKLIKWGMDTKAVIARFESERQALALMNHPNIASVFDAGATEQGRPYFAMELVHGEPITEYCDKNRLTIKERLALFIQACDGVQHAHQKGVIHRDIKPSNILITIQDDRPVPKIIDFGVAKATSQRLTERTVYTELGQLIGTPEYMSPEQAEMTGIDIDTRTDVYSLGVLLYELLVGAQPFDPKTLRQANFDDMRRKIREEEPPKPSTKLSRLGEPSTIAAKNRRVELRSLERELRGDLDWINMKALEKDRTRRYGSPSELAADIERHLRNEPVLASPPSNVYRATKFVRRHQIGVGVAAAFGLLLLAFSVVMTVQAGRIARERDRANREALAAREVSDFLTDLFQVSDPSEARGNTVTAREILDRGAKDIEEKLGDQPEVKAQLMATIGEVYLNLGLYLEAGDFLEQAVKLHSAQLGRDHAQTVSTLHSLANLYWTADRLDEAEVIYEEIIEVRTRELGKEHPETLSASFDLASLYYVQDRDEEMEALSQEVLAAQRRILGEAHPDTLRTMNNLAVLSISQKRYNDAAALLDEILMHEVRQLGDDHPSTLQTVHNLASVLARLGELDRAESLFDDVIEGRSRVLGEEHDRTVTSKVQLAILYAKTGRHGEAEILFDEAVEQRRRAHGEAHRFTLTTLEARAQMFVEQGRYEEAEKDLLTIFRAIAAAPGGSHALKPMATEALIELYEAWGKPEKAAEYRAMLPKEESE